MERLWRHPPGLTWGCLAGRHLSPQSEIMKTKPNRRPKFRCKCIEPRVWLVRSESIRGGEKIVRGMNEKQVRALVAGWRKDLTQKTKKLCQAEC